MDFCKNNFDEGKYINEILDKNGDKNIEIKMSTGAVVHLYEIPDEILLTVALGGRWSDDKYEFGCNNLLVAFLRWR